jgi:tetratricopeptide (TPR) repeat protein
MSYWAKTIFAGMAIGAILLLTPLGGYLRTTEDIDLSKLEEFSRDELLKKIERMRIDAVRLISDGRYEEAFQVLLKLIDINHYDQFPYVQMSRTIENLGEPTFLDYFRKANNNFPAVETDRTLAAIYFHSNRDREAKKHIDQFLMAKPDDLAGTFYKGAIARLSGDSFGAIQILESVIKREKTYYFAYLELQQAYENMGNEEMANKMMELALKNSPANNKDGICHGLPPAEDKKSKQES